MRGDIRDAELLRAALAAPEVAIVHLASIVSGGAERDFDLALDVNLDGGRALVAACRAHGTAPRLVFTSSLATFGGELALGPVDDDTRQTPLTTYGATKAMLELLFADATRKGFLDARSARPPTVVVRPGPQRRRLELRQRGRARAAGRAPGDAAGQPRPAGGRDRRRHHRRLPRAAARDRRRRARPRPGTQPPASSSPRASCSLRCTRSSTPARLRPSRSRSIRPPSRSCARGRRTGARRGPTRSACRATRTPQRSCAPTSRASAGERGAPGRARRLRASGRRGALVPVRRAGRRLQGRGQGLRDRRSRAHRRRSRSSATPSTARCCAPSTRRSSRGTT